MILDKHWWRTADGRLVPDGDPDSAFLAYPRGHEVADHLAEQIGLTAAVKRQGKPADKMVAKQADKAAPAHPPKSGPGSGIDAWRAHAAEVTGESPEALAELSRDDLIELVGA